MDDIDIDLVKFFHSVVIDEIERESSSNHKESLKKIQRLKNDISSLSPCSPSTLCAYVYNYAPCAASTLYRHFKDMISVNNFLLRRIIIRQSFTVCCFSSGLSVDFLALTRLLDFELRDLCSGDGYEGNRIIIDFVIISTDSYWRPIMEKMSKKLLEDLKDSTPLVFNFSFVAIDSSLSLTDDIKKTLSQSDFVTFVHFLRNLSSSEKAVRLQLMEDVIKHIPEGAIFFVLASPDKRDWCGVEMILESNDEPMKEIYGPLSYNVHRMRMLCRKQCIKLFSKHYGWQCCALESVNSVAAWYKGMSKKL